MKKFIKKTIFLVSPLIIFVVLMESLLRNIPNDFKYKNTYLINNSNNISKLFLGSSHTYYGINPDYITGNSFNAGYVSQTIDLDNEILKLYKNNWKELEYIIIPIDYATLYLKLSKTVEGWRMKNYNLYYKMGLSNNISENSEMLSVRLGSNLKRIISYYLLNKSPVTSSKLGYGIHAGENKDLTKTGKEAALRNTRKDLSLLNENLKTLKEIITFASENNTKIIFYTSPAYKTYVSNLDLNQLNLSINTISEIAEKNSNCHYFNLLEDPRFIASDFRDADHLNSKGAKKLSLRVDELISNIQ